MNRFYEELKTALALPEGDIWSETVLAGEHAGEKRLSCGDGVGAEGEQKVKACMIQNRRQGSIVSGSAVHRR